MQIEQDTIIAPATASGGALSLIRLSGRRAVEIADRLFRGRRPLAACPSHTAHFGTIHDQDKSIDEVVATLFLAPNSYTGEDTVEFSCHGSSYILGEVLRLAIEAGARMAEPGEFTRRAYLAGRMDLAQAEAVADLIASTSEAAHRIATHQMRGGYSSALDKLRDELLSLTALLELELDFGEEEVEFASRTQLKETMHSIGREIERLKRSFRLGNAIKEGIPVAIVGAPNVGKSTLMNQLLQEDRAMVSEIAGTTRDVIEERLTIEGLPFRILDTAGLRSTEDRLEQMGIERTRQTIERAQIVIWMVEATQLPATAPFTLRADQQLICVANKIDCAPDATLPADWIALSARTGEGIDRLCRAMCAVVPTEQE
ncbi:MAG: tRNA uridine-5-carboxymethylaminomethyl(34) synthesis GTPase MnmE, partial [Alistipes sp.]|nr:tRNA uridine-5-carboxymethylaminomethyl(34) synthesis GTPase MnmE [Alistipes sp.]